MGCNDKCWCKNTVGFDDITEAVEDYVKKSRKIKDE
jgi:hypothetical protein